MRPLSTRLIALALALLFTKAGHGQQLPPPVENPPVRRPDLPTGPEPAGAEIQKLLFDIRPSAANEGQIAGLPAESKPEPLDWGRVYALALIRARDADRPRMESLQPDRLAEAVKAVGDFARFRGDFFSNKAFRDPAFDLLALQAGRLRIENARWTTFFLERWSALVEELVQGESSGLGESDRAQTAVSLSEARRALAHSVADYRDRLDALKVSLGLSPQASAIVDMSPLTAFRDNFEVTNRWFLDPRRQREGLTPIAKGLPSIGDVAIEGRPVLAEIEREPNRMGEVLAQAARLAQRREPGDAVELRVRRRLRHLAEIRGDYEHERRMSALAAGQLDSAFEQIIAPPAGDRAQRRPAPSAASLAGHVRQIGEGRSRLVTLWTEFRAERLALYRDLGAFPFENWADFYGQFTAQANSITPAPQIERALPGLQGVPALPPPPPPGGE